MPTLQEINAERAAAQMMPLNRIPGPRTPPTWSNGVDPGWAPGTIPGQGGVAPIPRMDREGQYVDYASRQEGWKPEWNRYSRILGAYLRGDKDDVTEPIPGSPGVSHIPQADWAQIQQLGLGLKPMSGDEWGYKEGPPTYGPNPPPVMTAPPGGIQGPIEPRRWTPPGGEVIDPPGVPNRPPGWQGGGVRMAPESEYMNYLSRQKGWNPEWDQYNAQLERFLKDPSVDVSKSFSNNYQGPGAGAYQFPGIPQDVWADIGKWYEQSLKWGQMDGGPGGAMNFEAWKKRTNAFPNGVQGGGDMPPWLLAYMQRQNIPRNEQGDILYGGSQNQGQGEWYNQQKDLMNQQGSLQNLANKNAIRRQILSRMMNKRSSLTG